MNAKSLFFENVKSLFREKLFDSPQTNRKEDGDDIVHEQSKSVSKLLSNRALNLYLRKTH